MPSLCEKNLLNIVGSLYDAAQMPSADGWRTVFGHIRREVAADGGSLSFLDPASGRYQMLVGTFEEKFFDEYNDCFHAVSPLRRKLSRLRELESLNRADVLPDAEFVNSEFYQEFLRRYDVFNYEYHLLFRDGGAAAGIAFSRHRKSQNFGLKERLFLETLIPHIARSIQISYRCSHYRQDLEILRACFEQMTQGAMVVDVRGRVIYSNSVASGLIERSDGIRTDGKGLIETIFPADTKRLRTMLSDIFENNLRVREGLGGFMTVNRAAGRRPMSLFAAPFAERDAMFFSGRRLALIFINDPEAEICDVEPLLRRMYRLTPAETKIATLITRGNSVKEVCRILDIKENTIRTHLKRVFSKTETKRQSELVKLVMSNSARIGKFSDLASS